MKTTIKLLKSAKNIALVSHANPDPDTIGSTIALYDILSQMGKKVELFCDTDKNDNYAFLTAYNSYKFGVIDSFKAFDLVVAVDVASESMLGGLAQPFLAHENTLRIDHHASGIDYAKHNLMIPYSACAVLIFNLSKKLKVKISKDTATALYFAICGDTGIFKNNNTDSVTFRVCAELFEAGAEFRKVYSEFFEKKTVPYIKLTSNTLLNASLNNEFGYAILSVSDDDYQKFNASKDENIGNLPHSYLNCGYKIAVILKEKEDGIHCSLRSKFEYDCSKIAETFGGGGHKNASGCKIEASLDEAKLKIENAIKQYLNTQQEAK